MQFDRPGFQETKLDICKSCIHDTPACLWVGPLAATRALPTLIEGRLQGAKTTSSTPGRDETQKQSGRASNPENQLPFLCLTRSPCGLLKSVVQT
eukprot:1161173-Pelagomonas_calceolata.AAC.5